MKHLLTLLVAIFLVSPIFAQFEIGINGGLAITNASISYDYNNNTQTKTSGYRPAFVAEGMYNLKHWRFGLAIAYQKEKLTYQNTLWIVNNTSAIATSTRSEDLVPAYLLISRSFDFRNFQAYCGISFGAIKVNSSITDVGKEVDFSYVNQSYGLICGADAGITYFISSNWGVNMEAAINDMNIEGTALENERMSYPVTLGVRYKF